MSDSFEVRGVIEGFYGQPWSDGARRRAFEVLGPSGMNAYVWAPKDDPLHRRRWREPHPPADIDDLLGQADAAAAAGIRFGYSLAPGLDVDARSGDDRAALTAKLAPLASGGVSWFVLAFDDIPSSPEAGRDHAELLDHAREIAPDARWTLVPTDYVGTRPTAYLDQLTADLGPDVDLMWTGSTVVPPTISAVEARARRDATNGQPILLWDNYPVNDAFMEGSLHLGPLVGRDPELAGLCRGVLANPMSQAEASLIPLLTVAEFLLDPSGYDPSAAWARALHSMDDGSPAVGALARACATSRLDPRAPLHDLVDDLAADRAGAAQALRAELAAAPGAHQLPDLLGADAAPWLDQLGRETQVAQLALALMAPEEPLGVEALMQAAFTMLFVWNDVRGSSPRVVHGPRLACYPAVVQAGDGTFTIDPRDAVVEDASAVDRLCRLALDRLTPTTAPSSAAAGSDVP